MDSKNIVRTCEKCKNASLLLTQEITGKASFNVVLKADLGVVAERWSCQQCDYYFEVTLEKPRPPAVWLSIGSIFSVIGLLATIIPLIQLLKNTTNKDTTFTLIFGILLLISGFIIIYFSYKKLTIFERNYIVDGLTPPPIFERKHNLPLARRSRKCSCKGELVCVGDVTRSFNTLHTGTIYTFQCNNTECKKTIVIESIYRSIIFLIIAFIITSFASFMFENSALGWTFFVSLLLISIYIIILRFWRIYLRIKFPRFSTS